MTLDYNKKLLDQHCENLSLPIEERVYEITASDFGGVAIPPDFKEGKYRVLTEKENSAPGDLITLPSLWVLFIYEGRKSKDRSLGGIYLRKID